MSLSNLLWWCCLPGRVVKKILLWIYPFKIKTIRWDSFRWQRGKIFENKKYKIKIQIFCCDIFFLWTKWLTVREILFIVFLVDFCDFLGLLSIINFFIGEFYIIQSRRGWMWGKKWSPSVFLSSKLCSTTWNLHLL